MSLPDVIKHKNQERIKGIRNLNARIRRVHKILVREKNGEAESFFLERERQKDRCLNCPGCVNFKSGKCGLCESCLQRKGCVELSRMCFCWPLVDKPGRPRANSSIGSSIDQADLKIELLHLKSAQTEVENLTAMQVSFLQEADPPLVAHHVMGEDKITMEAELVESRAEDLVIMGEAHLSTRMKMSDFLDEDIVAENVELDGNVSHSVEISAGDASDGSVSIHEEVDGNKSGNELFKSGLGENTFKSLEEGDVSAAEDEGLEKRKDYAENIFLNKVGEIQRRKFLNKNPKLLKAKDTRAEILETKEAAIGRQRLEDKEEMNSEKDGRKSTRKAASGGAYDLGLEAHLRAKIRKSGELRVDLTQELKLLERRIVYQEKRGTDREGIDNTDQDLKTLKKGVDELSDIESHIVELSLKVWGKEFSERRGKEWWRWRSEMVERVQAGKEGNWLSLKVREEPRYEERARSSSFSGGAHLLERVGLPKFSGQLDDWADFRHAFRELIKIGHYPDLVQIAQLRNKLTPEGVNLISGLTKVEEVWNRLDERYGNHEMAVVTALTKLMKTEVPKGPGYLQVETVALAVQKAQATMRSVGREDELFTDIAVLGTLLTKLPHALRERWFQERGKDGEPVSRKHEGEIFLNFLGKERKAAQAAKVSSLGMESRKTVNLEVRNVDLPKTNLATTAHALNTQQVSVDVKKDENLKLGAGSGPAGGGGVGSSGGRGPRLPESMEDALTWREKAKSSLGPCPACKGDHVYTRKFANLGALDWPSDRLSTCPVFRAMSVESRAKLVEGETGCGICTSRAHQRDKCYQVGRPEGKCNVVESGSRCNGDHDAQLHGSKSVYCHAHGLAFLDRGVGEGKFFEVFTAPVVRNPDLPLEASSAKIFVDPGSDTNFIREAFAEELQLTGEPLTCHIRVVNDEYRKYNTKKYVLWLRNRTGKHHVVSAVGIPTVTTIPACPDISALEKLLVDYPGAARDRACGEMDLLLGLPTSSLHGWCVAQVGELRVLSSLFGCGWLIRGTHPLGNREDRSYAAMTSSITQVTQEEPETYAVFHLDTYTGQEKMFHELEELGSTPAPLCPSCKGCRDCMFRTRKLSRADQEVLARIEREMEVNDQTGQITASYPWKPCVRRLTSNRKQAATVQSNIEKRMKKEGSFKEFQKEIEKAIGEEKVRELSTDEMEAWKGPVHYITIFPVLKKESLSTKLRIVSNAALKNVTCRLSLNDCMWAGPNALALLVDVLVHWRALETVVMYDLTRAYQAIYTRETELHVRRFLWRAQPDREWRTLAYTRATFGDVAAGLLLEVAKRRVAEMGRMIDPDTADQIRDKVYVDDGVAGGSTEDANRMKGEFKDDKWDGTIPRILGLGGMKVKFLVISGSSCREDREALGGAILGVPYEVEDDVIPYRYKIEMPERSEASAEGAPVTVERLEDFESGKEKMTRRKILSCLMAEYDPLGLISPALVKSKLMIRGLYRKEAKLGWDSTVSEVETGEWVKRFRRQLTEGAAVFPRSTKPQGAVGIPDLTGFADSSLEALCVAIYVVWTVGDGSRVARLMMAKCRVAPLSGTSIPRGELQAMVVLLRLMASMVSSLWMKVGKITVFSDSQCTLAALRKVGAPLRPYFANRVSESLALLKELEKLCDTVVRVRHVPGKLNPADLGTRGTATMTDLGSHSTWQDGPAFLRLPEDQWPETLEEEGAIPTEECVQFHVNLAQEMSPTKKLAKNPWMILIGQIRNRTSLGSLLTKMAMQAMMGEKWDSIARIFARVIKAIIQGDQEKISSLKDPSPTEVCLAKEMMFVASAPSAVQAFQQDQLLSLGGILRGGEVWIEGRVRKEKLADLLGMSRLRIIMPGEPLAVLITRAAHCQDHRRNYKDVVARVRRLAWIPKGTRLAKTIVDHCPICRLQDKKEGKQLMGPLPDLRLQSSAPFVNTSLDLFGPFNVKDVAKGRRTFKCWAVAFACLTTKAVCFLACPGYDAVTFITTYRGFVAIYGPPTVVYSDHAPSIIRASEDMDWEKVAKELGRKGTEWRLTLKGCSWRNGVAERVIRSARHTLSHLLQKDKLLNFQELNTILLEVSAVINSRPLAIRVGSEGNFHSISASDILLGRTPQARPVPLRMEDEQDNNAVADNFFHLQELVSAWWEEWMVHCFPEMVYRTKWKVSHRDLCVGDIGHIKYDSKVGRPSWKLARVTEVHPGADQKVRTITVSFRPTRAGEKVLPYNPKGLTKMKIGVQRFAVLYTTEEQNLRAASEVETGDLYKTPLRPHPPSGGV